MDALDLAVHQTAHDFGLPELARRMGKGEQVLRNKVNPHSESHVLTLREAIAMVLITGDLRIAVEVAKECGGGFAVAEAMPRDVGVVMAFLASQREHGDVARAVEEALSDGQISPREQVDIQQQISEARKGLDVLDAAVGKAAKTGARVTS